MRKLAALVIAAGVACTLVPASAFANSAPMSESSLRMEAESVKLAENSSDIDVPSGVHVSVKDNSVEISVSAIPGSGTADVVRMRANQYYPGDKLHGLLKTTSKGYVVGKYTLGSENTVISTKRFTASGDDRVYTKYYLVQNDKIIAGPIYPTQIASQKQAITIETESIKGIFNEDAESPDIAADLGAQHASLNIDFSHLILPNEDANGNSIDYSSRNDVVEFECNGEDYYFAKDQINYIDLIVSKYSQRGIDVQAIIIASVNKDWSTYPRSLVYVEPSNGESLMGFNTSNERGRKYFAAAMEFLGSRYSQSRATGYISDYVIGNEIDYAYNYWKISNKKSSDGPEPLDVYMEEYERTLRIANNALKKYAADISVSVPLTHNWTVNGWESLADSCQDESSSLHEQGHPTRSPLSKNSYRPKDILDWLATRSNERGDFDWALAGHYDCTNLPQASISYYDTGMDRYYPNFKVTGDYETSKFVTISNMELIQQYLSQPALKYNAPDGSSSTRGVYLTETAVSSLTGKSTDELNTQAAYIAMLYYKAAHMSCIKAVDYYRLKDHEVEAKSSFTPGLLDPSGKQKPAYNLYKHIDTDKSISYSRNYLKYVSYRRGNDPNNFKSDFSDWKDAVQVTSASDANSFNWEKSWDVSNIEKIQTEASVDRQLSIAKAALPANEPLEVTASGLESDWVGLYKAGDQVEGEGKADPIYFYYLGRANNGISHTSGKTYDIRAYGERSKSRYDDAQLVAGSYKVVLFDTEGNKLQEQHVTVSNVDISTPALSIEKETFDLNEDVLITASGIDESSQYWVGIYDKGAKYGPATTEGTSTSVFWYYVSPKAIYNSSNTEWKWVPSGTQAIVQAQAFNRSQLHQDPVLSEGEYTVYLFKSTGSGDDEYQVQAKQDFAVAAQPPVSLSSITYDLDNDGDGFAAGRVTVAYAAGSKHGADCIMYWADETGTPLEEYEALASFKLTGKTSTAFDMPQGTIIPEGARKLVAYAANGKARSDTAAIATLPAGASYNMSAEGVKSEFQMVSDLHVPYENDSDGEYVTKSEEHLKLMLNDIKALSPKSAGIFVNGDIAHHGSKKEFAHVWDLYKEVYSGDSNQPRMHYSIGNHDWLEKSSKNFIEAVNDIYKATGDTTAAGDDEIEFPFYDEFVNGYHYIYLGGESGYSNSNTWLKANLSDDQLEWFDKRLAKYTAEDNGVKPIFVLLHQPMYNTVAGSLQGQGWDGVVQEAKLRKILKKYPNVIMFGGHSHWEMNSYRNFYGGSVDTPAYFNTSSIGYLWSSYGNVNSGGWGVEGSDGYFFKVYDGKILVQGRNFETGKWLPSATYVLERQDITIDKNVIETSLDGESATVGATSSTGAKFSYTSSNKKVVTVDSHGNLIRKTSGEATIYVTALASETKTVNRAEVKVKVAAGNLTPVSGLKVTNTTATSIDLSWTPTASPQGYEVFNNTTGESFFTQDASTSITGLVPQTAYSFTVRPYQEVEDENTYGPKASVTASTLKATSGTGALKNGDSFTAGSGSTKARYAVTSVSGKTVAYTSSLASKSAKRIVIPATIKINGATYKVTAIGTKALANHKSLAEVSLGSNVKVIYAKAFASCTKLVKATGGKSVTSIGSSAFAGCSKLKSISSISNSKKLKSIGASAFSGDKSLASFTLGASVSKIGASAFKGCSKLKTLVVKSKKLTKSGVKKSLSGSKIKTIKVKVGSKKQNASYMKKYQKIFTKKNCSIKIQVTR